MNSPKIKPIIAFFFCIYVPFLFGQSLKNIKYSIIIPDSSDYSNPLKLWATHYYVHQANYDSAGFPLKGIDQKTIFTKVSLCDWCSAAVEGTEIALPDGQKMVHDGYFFAGDVGGDIKGYHIDVFTGLSRRNPFPFITSQADGTFFAYLVKHKELIQQFQQMHRY